MGFSFSFPLLSFLFFLIFFLPAISLAYKILDIFNLHIIILTHPPWFIIWMGKKWWILMKNNSPSAENRKESRGVVVICKCRSHQRSKRKKKEKTSFFNSKHLCIKVTSINFFNSHIYRLWHVIHIDIQTFLTHSSSNSIPYTSLEFYFDIYSPISISFLFSK